MKRGQGGVGEKKLHDNLIVRPILSTRTTKGGSSSNSNRWKNRKEAEEEE